MPGFVFKRGQLDFAIRYYPAVCVNDRSACAGELTFLRSEISDLVLVIGIHADGKHLRLLRQITSDFSAKDVFPITMNVITNSDRSGGDHPQQCPQQDNAIREPASLLARGFL